MITPRMYKMAAAVIEMGTPEEAGRGIAEIVKFLMQRISPAKRHQSILKLRNKIWYLNEEEIASKRTPSSASMGQSITFIKTILNGHNPSFVRAVLNNVVKHLY